MICIISVMMMMMVTVIIDRLPIKLSRPIINITHRYKIRGRKLDVIRMAFNDFPLLRLLIYLTGLGLLFAEVMHR